MFAIYDVQGRRFRDTLENLRKVKRKPAPIKVGLSSTSEDGPSAYFAGGYSVSAQACEAYREKLPVQERERVVHAHQIMNSPVETIGVSDDIVSAWKRLRLLGYRQLPVLNDDRQIAGMLTERNLLQYLIVDDDKIIRQSDKSVGDAMLAPVITADPVTDIRRIASVMIDYRQNAVPITSETDELVGLVSRGDILRATTSDPPLSLWT